MSAIRKLFLNTKLVRQQKMLVRTRAVHLTAAEVDDKFVVKSDVGNVNIPNVTIPEVIEPKLELYKNYTAVECGVTGKKYSYQQLQEKSRNLSKSLRKIFNLQKGDKVAVISQNSPDYVVAVFGSIKSGMIVTTLNPLYTPDEITKQLIDADAKVIIAQDFLCSNVKQAFTKMKKQIPIITIKQNVSDSIPAGTVSFEEITNTKIDIPDVELGRQNDTVFIPYSSGTTGLPKGVELMHRNLLSNFFQTSHPEYNLLEPPSGDYQSRIPLVLPMYHIYGFTVGMLISLCNGSKLITLPKFTPDSYIDVLKNNAITHIFAAPPLVLFINNHPGVKTEYFKELKVLVSGAAPLGYADELKLKEKVKKDDIFINQGYGLTETSPLVSVVPRSHRTTKETGGTIGKVLPNTAAKIISPDGQSGKSLGPNEQGELLIKGPQVMKGYYNKPEETEKSFMDGWFKTGDVAYYNQEGFFFITERLKELIKVKGFQVPPAELEAVIRTFPEVEDVGVIGIPHPTHGEVPRAYIVPKTKNKFNVKELQNYVAEKVANYKQLAGGVQIMESIPRNPSGKILRRELKQQFLEKGI